MTNFQIAQDHFENGRYKAAREIFEQLNHVEKRNADVLDALGRVCMMQSQLWSAVGFFEKANNLVTDVPEFMNNLAIAYSQVGRHDAALEVATRSDKIRPRNAMTLKIIVENLHDLGRIDDAKTALENAQKSGLKDIDVAIDIGRMEGLLGNTRRALAIYRTVHAAGLSRAGSLFGIAELVSADEPFPEKAFILNALTSGKLARRDQVLLHFAMGRYYDRRGMFDKAFDHFVQANNKKPHNEAGVQHLRGKLAKAKANLTRAKIKDLQKKFGNPSIKPIFVVGMPRSGTTLAEQILAAHSTIHGADELKFFEALAKEIKDLEPSHNFLKNKAKEYLALLRACGGSAARVVDKMPLNFRHLWLMAILFPKARIVFCRREPIANCTSCFTTQLTSNHDYTGSLSSLAEFYKLHLELMAVWKDILPSKIFTLDYESVIETPEVKIRELFAFLEIDWEDSVLSFHTQTRAVRTPSRDQVAKPLNDEGLKKWMRFGDRVAELEEQFG